MTKILAKIAPADCSLTVVLDNGETLTVSAGHPNYNALKIAFKSNDGDGFVKAYNESPAKTTLQEYVRSANDNRVEVRDNRVYFNGEVVHNVVADRILAMKDEGEDFLPMVKFLENLMKNPSYNSREQLYKFLEQKCLPIDNMGCFLGYKAVRSDYMDKYSGTIYNGVGAKVSMPRHNVDDLSSNHCSKGLHIGGLQYSGPGGWYCSSSDKTMIVRCNPKDVVSVPTDYNFTKLRTCAYEVVCEYKAPLERSVYNSSAGERLYEDCSCSSHDDIFDDNDCDKLYPEDILSGYTYKFDYYSHGTTKRRSVYVEHVGDESITVILEPDDPSFVADANNYRCMLLDGISNVELTGE